MHASSGRPVYEQVDEQEESGSGHVALKLNDQNSELRTTGIRVNSPSYQDQGAAQSAKIKRKGVSKTHTPNQMIDTSLPQSSEKMQMLKSKDPMTTPKLHQLQEVHKTTILEENETMRGSIDRYPGSKLSMQPVGSNKKRFNRVQ